jgi:hypothetical protein
MTLPDMSKHFKTSLGIIRLETMMSVRSGLGTAI